MWGAHGPRPEPNHALDALFASMTASADVEVSCSAEEAWDLVSNVERIGEFSPRMRSGLVGRRATGESGRGTVRRQEPKSRGEPNL